MECCFSATDQRRGEKVVSPNTVLSLILLSLIALVFLRRWMMSRNLSHYSASDVVEKTKSSTPAILLDVRTVAEYSRGKIKGSINIPLHELRRRIPATQLLMKNGFKVANLRGGLAAWQAMRNN
jgi:rhodanese-related sulfurtransferase